MTQFDAVLATRALDESNSMGTENETLVGRVLDLAENIAGSGRVQVNRSKAKFDLGLKYPADLNLPIKKSGADFRNLLQRWLASPSTLKRSDSVSRLLLIVGGFDSDAQRYKVLPVITPESTLPTMDRVLSINMAQTLISPLEVLPTRMVPEGMLGTVRSLPDYDAVVLGTRSLRHRALRKLWGSAGLKSQTVNVCLVDTTRKRLFAAPIENPRWRHKRDSKSDKVWQDLFEELLVQQLLFRDESDAALNVHPEVVAVTQPKIEKLEHETSEGKRATAWRDLVALGLDESKPARFHFDPIARMLEIFDGRWLQEHDKEAVHWVADAMAEYREKGRSNMGVELAEGLRSALNRANCPLSELVLLATIADETEKSGSSEQARFYYVAALEKAVRFNQTKIRQYLLKRLKEGHPDFVNGLDLDRFE